LQLLIALEKNYWVLCKPAGKRRKYFLMLKTQSKEVFEIFEIVIDLVC
jgi:hypothetical protein